MSKRIIFDCERMKYPFTGLYYFCKELGTALLKNNENSDKEISFYLPKKEAGIFGNDQKYIIQDRLHKFFPKNLPAYDLWHCTFQGTNYLPFRKSRLKLITTIHDLNFLHEKKSESKQGKYLQNLQRLLDRSDIVVAISNFVKNEVLDNLELDPGKIKVIYNGRNHPPNLSFEKPAGMDDRPFFFSIGTITEKKNFHVLPSMLQNNDHNLVIAGITQNQNYHDRILEEARKLGVQNRVSLIGAVTESEKFWLLKHCAAFCFPSLAEGFGLPVIEAMQLGTPVILSKATSLPEVGGPHAIYFDDMDTEAISRAANSFLNMPFDDLKKNELVKWASRFDWSVAAEKYLELYDSI